MISAAAIAEPILTQRSNDGWQCHGKLKNYDSALETVSQAIQDSPQMGWNAYEVRRCHEI